MVSYSKHEKEIVRQGFDAIRSVLFGNDERAKLSLLLCLDWFMDPYYGQDISDIKDELITILQEVIISDDSFSVKEDALNLLTSYEWPPFPILEKSLDTIDEKLLSDVKYAINMDKEISRALNEANKLLSEMSDHHLRGSYKVVSEEQIEWQIQDDVRIDILLHGSDAGLHDVLVIFFNDPDGKEHRCYYGDDYPHDSIIELLLDYNAMEFNVKRGLFGWRLKTK